MGLGIFRSILNMCEVASTGSATTGSAAGRGQEHLQPKTILLRASRPSTRAFMGIFALVGEAVRGENVFALNGSLCSSGERTGDGT